MAQLKGLHHITAIAGSPQENVDFYVGILGMRLVKKSVNQDDVGTYHLFFADGEGHPGTDLTFFPWTHHAPSRKGVGLNVEVPLAVPKGSLGYWKARLESHGVEAGEPGARFGESFLPLRDPHGVELTLVETGERELFSAWPSGPVPEEMQVRGLHAAVLWERSLAPTGEFLTETLGFVPMGSDDGRHRFGLDDGGSGKLLEIREVPDAPRGIWGTGTVHHVAWRLDDEEAATEVRSRVERAGRRPTGIIDRFWFKSVYFTEPGGVLFELATDGPGFAVDEEPDRLGRELILPPWLEPRRPEIEEALPPLTTD